MSTYSSHDYLLSLTCDILHAHSAVLIASDGQGEYRVSAAVCAQPPTPVAARITPGKGLAGLVLRSNEPVFLNEFKADSHLLGYYEPEAEAAITAFMGAPLPESSGALCVDSISGQPFTKRDESILVRFARLLAGQTRLSEESDTDDVRRYFDAFEQLQKLRLQQQPLPWHDYLSLFLGIVAKASSFEYVALAMRPEDSSTYTIEGESTPLLLAQGTEVSFPVESSGLVSWILRNNGQLPVFADGVESALMPLFGKQAQVPAFQSAIGLPVMHNRTVYGVLVMAGLTPRPLPEQLRAFAAMSANEVGVHVATLYLQHRLQAMLRKAHKPRKTDDK